jgi:hypothetical protein
MSGVFTPRVAFEALIAVVVFSSATAWGLHYWRLSAAAGRQPQFYQEYFEPAVMVGCGKGFAVVTPEVQAVTEFLTGRRSALECSEIPKDAHLSPPVLQGAWRYLMIAVGLGWKVLGVSWEAIGPLAALAFGACIALAYAIFRLTVPWPIALASAALWAVSSIHLWQLPHFRDYTKAPFLLVCLWILGMLVKKVRSAAAVLLLAGAYGLTVGIGYGFRTDLLIAIVPAIVAIVCFLPGGFLNRWRVKSGALATFALAFTISAWPVIGAVVSGGSCQWHFALLGLTTDFTDALGLAPAVYDWGNKYSDRWIYATIATFSERQNPGAPLIDYCSHQYDVVSFDYVRYVVTTFPADMVTRGLAAVDRVTQFPFAVLEPPVPDLAPDLYGWRFRVLRHFRGTGLLFVIGALLAVATADLRIGLFLVFLVLYFSSYPAIQYGYRHAFHLEVIPIWSMAFVCYVGFLGIRRARQLVDPAVVWPAVRRVAIAVACGAGIVAGGWAGLAVLRSVQSRNVAAMLKVYLHAPKTAADVEDPDEAGVQKILMPGNQKYPHQFLDIVLRGSSCASAPVTLRYEKRIDADLTRTIHLPSNSTSDEPTHIFIPVYKFFEGVEMSSANTGCLVGIFRVDDRVSAPLLLTAVLPPDWEHGPLFQTLQTW